ncbi:hypothetical protein K491DRAFT_237453 [Lophiostoma macrostomum CBS 122681]|uniref:Uncharacterized protein n=1 Tax=Lophiostoma macrostomum CBS 122681 TaxID=1314788 RepID=A0A6A6TJ15_9PLEO|nr:hypothetical protein K491DRAFT_237453 [Lophiostoma macrostomum CBS 122681]
MPKSQNSQIFTRTRMFLFLVTSLLLLGFGTGADASSPTQTPKLFGISTIGQAGRDAPNITHRHLRLSPTSASSNSNIVSQRCNFRDHGTRWLDVWKWNR